MWVNRSTTTGVWLVMEKVPQVNVENGHYGAVGIYCSLRSKCTYLQHAVIGVDKWFVDAKFSIAHKLLSVQTVAADKSAHSSFCSLAAHRRTRKRSKEFIPQPSPQDILAFQPNF